MTMSYKTDDGVSLFVFVYNLMKYNAVLDNMTCCIRIFRHVFSIVFNYHQNSKISVMLCYRQIFWLIKLNVCSN